MRDEIVFVTKKKEDGDGGERERGREWGSFYRIKVEGLLLGTGRDQGLYILFSFI